MAKKTIFGMMSATIILVLALSACSPVDLAMQVANNARNAFTGGSADTQQTAPVAQAPASQENPASSPAVIGDWEAMQETLQQIYEKVNPSVVNIQVISQIDLGPNSPFGLLPGGGSTDQVPVQQGQGSGFVWDKEGYIVTNNHVVDGATQVTVVFWDGWTVDAKVIATDVNSDLAVIQVDVDQERLYPIQLADSDQVKVGQLAVAIGNPYGLSGTQTVGFISALGRSLDVQSTGSGTGTYSIPDVIQTDAPINPGNSGGVLVNDVGQVVGVTAAIQSSTDSSAGIGFVIPSAIVQRVVPGLIQNGSYEYPWIGISGGTLTQSLASANDLGEEQRGAFVSTVTDGGPADEAGLIGSTDTRLVDNQEYPVGGDVITAIDGNAITSFDDIVSYLIRKTQPGQQVTLTVLRDGQEKEIDLTLGTRPTTSEQNVQAFDTFENFPDTPGNPDESPNQSPNQPTSQASLGVSGIEITSEVALAIGLNEDQRGVLIQDVQDGSAADQAGLRGGDQEQTIGGQSILVGGDVITGFDGEQITTLLELRSLIALHSPGDSVVITLFRNGESIQTDVTLGER